MPPPPLSITPSLLLPHRRQAGPVSSIEHLALEAHTIPICFRAWSSLAREASGRRSPAINRLWADRTEIREGMERLDSSPFSRSGRFVSRELGGGTKSTMRRWPLELARRLARRVLEAFQEGTRIAADEVNLGELCPSGDGRRPAARAAAQGRRWPKAMLGRGRPSASCRSGRTRAPPAKAMWGTGRPLARARPT
jgi:hypothetical protein